VISASPNEFQSPSYSRCFLHLIETFPVLPLAGQKKKKDEFVSFL